MASPKRLIDPSLSRLRTDLISDQMGIWMTSRAMARTFAAVAWLVLALGYGGRWGWAWGVPLLFGGVVSWAHATQLSFLPAPPRLSALAPAVGRTVRRFFRLSTRPDLVDGPRTVDLLGLMVAAAATGHLVGVFGRVDAELAATGLLLACAVPTLANLVAHPSYAQYAGRPPYRVQRRLTAMVAGPAAILLLWPAHPTGPGRLIAVMGGLFLAGSAWRWAVHLDRTTEAVEDGLNDAYRAAIRELFFSLHNGLRNPARFVVNAVTREEAAARQLENALAALPPSEQGIVAEWRRADDTARQLTWNLATRISEYVEMARSGLSERPRTAADVVDAILRFHSVAKDRHPGPVVRQLDPTSLGSLDNELISACLTEFVTNAVVAQASSIEVRVEAWQGPPEASGIDVKVRCTCGLALEVGRPRAGTLGLLADHLELVNGCLVVEDHFDGSHTTIARWPTDAAPTELT